MTGIQIERLYTSRLAGPFPYAECRWLVDQEEQRDSGLVPELDHYFSSIAGYSSSASRLMERSSEALRTARNTLAKDCFEMYPDLQRYKNLITPEQTPVLYDWIRITEQLRLGLLGILETVANE
jgi:hypothetical protein